MFGSKNKNLGQTEEPPLPSPTGIRAQGPWDRSERSVESTAAFLDFGSILVRPISGMEIQVASNDSTNLAVLVSLGNSAVELRVAAASKHGDDWAQLVPEVVSEVSARGATPVERSGIFGPEVSTEFPGQDADGNAVIQPACFMGVQGKRWLLRATLIGPSAVAPDANTDLINVIRDLVIVRGSEARMLGEELPIQIPVEMQDPSS